MIFGSSNHFHINGSFSQQFTNAYGVLPICEASRWVLQGLYGKGSELDPAINGPQISGQDDMCLYEL